MGGMFSFCFILVQHSLSYVTLWISQHRQHTEIEIMMLGAKGKVVLPVKLGTFHAIHPFIVLRNVTIGCHLGADFPTTYGAVLDCEHTTLPPGK